MKNMAKLITNFLALTTIAMTSAFCQAANTDVPPEALNLFTKKVHPILRQYCIKCHDENSYIAPAHSHINPVEAFKEFSRLVNFSDPSQSKVLRMAKNQHFCTKHGVNCDIKDQVTADVTRVMLEYFSELNQATRAAVITSSLSKPKTASTQQVEAAPSTESSPESSYLSAPVTVDFSHNQFSMSFPISVGIFALTGPQFRLSFETLLKNGAIDASNIIKIPELGMVTNESDLGIYEMRGLKIFVNGTPIEALGGRKHSSYIVPFFGSQSNANSKTYKVIDQLGAWAAIKDGDQVQIGFDYLGKLDKYPTRLCKTPEAIDKVLSNIIGTVSRKFDVPFEGGPVSINSSPAEKENLCINVESMIDFEVPRRSLIMQKTIGPRPEALDLIKTWIEMTEGK